MAWAYRASSFAASASGNFNRTVTLGAAVSAGDRIIADVFARKTSATPPTPTVTDSVNGAAGYTEDVFIVDADGSDQVRASIFSLANSGAGTPLLTAVSSGSAGGIMAAAYNGLLATDPGTDTPGASAKGVAGAASSGATAATAAANELDVGVFFDTGWNYGISASNVGSGWTFTGAHGNDGASYQGMMEHKDSGATGAQTATTTSLPSGGSTIWEMLCAVYKLAGAAAQDTPELRGRPEGLRGQNQMQQLLAT